MDKTYTVKSGDTLFKIAEQFYNDGNKWEKIAKKNGNIKPQELQVGQTLTIPNSQG